jgi:hypothetical protein
LVAIAVVIIFSWSRLRCETFGLHDFVDYRHR